MASCPAHADTIRLATFNVELDRDGPGLLLRDILRGEDPQIDAIAQVIARIAPDILVLQRVDYDLDLRAISALRDVIAATGPSYPHIFARRPNSGLATGLDMDGDGRLGEPRDAQSYGEFAGQGGMAVLSRFPILDDKAQDFSALLWRDLPGALLPEVDGAPFPSAKAQEVQRLSSVGHWVVPVQVGPVALDLMVFHASPPVFDGPEDRNGKRNHDELIFWQHVLEGRIGTPPEGAYAVVGDANLDPFDSDGKREAIRALLSDPRLQDPRPMRADTAPGGLVGADSPRLDTVEWPAPGPGAMRVDYILPSADLKVTDAGVFWPQDGAEEAAIAQQASRHRLVWVDLMLPAP